jgi:hypothetical protein
MRRGHDLTVSIQTQNKRGAVECTEKNGYPFIFVDMGDSLYTATGEVLIHNCDRIENTEGIETFRGAVDMSVWVEGSCGNKKEFLFSNKLLQFGSNGVEEFSHVAKLQKTEKRWYLGRRSIESLIFVSDFQFVTPYPSKYLSIFTETLKTLYIFASWNSNKPKKNSHKPGAPWLQAGVLTGPWHRYMLYYW